MLHIPCMSMPNGYVDGSAMRLIGKPSNGAEFPVNQDYSINQVSKSIGVSGKYPQLSIEKLLTSSERERLKALQSLERCQKAPWPSRSHARQLMSR